MPKMKTVVHWVRDCSPVFSFNFFNSVWTGYWHGIVLGQQIFPTQSTHVHQYQPPTSLSIQAKNDQKTHIVPDRVGTRSQTDGKVSRVPRLFEYCAIKPKSLPLFLLFKTQWAKDLASSLLCSTAFGLLSCFMWRTDHLVRIHLYFLKSHHSCRLFGEAFVSSRPGLVRELKNIMNAKLKKALVHLYSLVCFSYGGTKFEHWDWRIFVPFVRENDSEWRKC